MGEKSTTPPVTRMKKLPPLAVLATFGLVLSGGACGTGNYTSENEIILESLPDLPGARVLSTESRPYFDCRVLLTWRRLGTVATVTYQAPADVTPEHVVQFYIENMEHGWHHRREDIGVASPVSAEEPPRPTPQPTLQPAQPTPQPVQSQQHPVPVVRFERGPATVYVQGEDLFSFDPRLPRNQPGQRFTVNIDSNGTVPRPYCD